MLTCAQEQPAAGSDSALQEIMVSAKRLDLIGTASTASEGLVTSEELALTPAYRPAQLLETVPGLVVTSHSGEGKANQYMMRGYSLDHGHDLAIYVDGMPVNEPTHAHGQGYADLNFLIPTLASGIDYTKGPYYASEGDFGSIGSVHLRYRDVVPAQVQASAGNFGFQNLLGACSTGEGDGNLLGALELQHYDGPWKNPDNQRKANLILRFSDGDDVNGLSLLAGFYHGVWNATTDQPLRAVAQGLIDRWGSLDPSDGGSAQRASFSGQVHAQLGRGQLQFSAYAVGNHLTLWNDFTHFLFDPVNGDQERQREDRVTLGADVSYGRHEMLGPLASEWLVGLRDRQDFNTVSRLPSQNRALLTAAQLEAVNYPSNQIEADVVRLNNVAGFVQLTTYWLPWLRTNVGIREDLIHGSDTGTSASAAAQAVFEPKLSIILTPAETTEVYVSAGRGFHSDDLRGVNQARLTGLGEATLLATQIGEEIGLREQLRRNLVFTWSLYNLDAQSETTYNPDVGQDTAGPASRRYGSEFNATYQAARWLEFYGSYSINHSRFRSPYDDGTGHVGEFLPNAPVTAGSFNAYMTRESWEGGLEYRYVGSFALSSDGVIRGHGYAEWNANVRYLLPSGWRFGLGLYNILNRRDDAAEFWYVDRLPGESTRGVADFHAHALEPLSVRLMVGRSI